MPGDWVLIHVGFAMSKISEADAADQMRTLTMLGETEAAMQEVRGYGLEDGEPGPPGPRAAAMKFVDEFRAPELIAKAGEEIRKLADPDAALSHHGSMRRTHPRHLSFRLEGSASRKR